jgi:hypothetical protein
MQTKTESSSSLPFELGETRSFKGLTIVPLFAGAAAQAEYVGLDEAAASGLTVTEVSEAGIRSVALPDQPARRLRPAL